MARGLTGLWCVRVHTGAGKTSFLNLLSSRTKQGTIGGEILTNGYKVGREQSKRISAYVMQEDTLLGNLTPRELLTYSALLRLPRSVPKREKLERVEKVLAQLNLVRCADTRVGVTGVKRGISGGERRRVSIGLDLIVNPRLLFLDEPTSGLDSTMAEQVVTILKNLARQGRTVRLAHVFVSSPSSSSFALVPWVWHRLYAPFTSPRLRSSPSLMMCSSSPTAPSSTAVRSLTSPSTSRPRYEPRLNTLHDAGHCDG